MLHSFREVWCLILFASLAVIVADAQRVPIAWKISQNENIKDGLTGVFNGHQMKRGFITAGVAALKGKKASNTLLRGTKPLPNVNKIYRDFQKAGNYDQALRDFYSVKPTSVRSVTMTNGDHGVVGRVGNRRLVLVTAGENTIGQPTIWITKIDDLKQFERDKDLNIPIDRIIYSSRKMGEATFGEVGDRTIMTQSKGETGQPTLRIVKTKLLNELLPVKLLDSHVDRIIYTD